MKNRTAAVGGISFVVLVLSMARMAVAAADAPPLEGTTWRVTHIRGQDDKAIAALPQPATVRFDRGAVQGFGGCNHLAGQYQLEGDKLNIGRLAGTMMACPEPVMAVESAFKQTLAGVLRYAIAQDRLTLSAGSDPEPTLAFVAMPPLRLEGVTWEVTGFNNGRHAVVSPLNGTKLTVSFQTGAIVGNAGCNTFRAPYKLDGDGLTIGPAAATRKLCDDAQVMEQERQFLAAIESATRWAIERGMLDLHRADGERVLSANPAK